MTRFLNVTTVILLLLSNECNLQAAPFDTGMITLKQPNNVSFTGRIWGDEFIYWAETQDGYRFVETFDDGIIMQLWIRMANMHQQFTKLE